MVVRIYLSFHDTSYDEDTTGSLKFPDYPHVYMPWSKDPGGILNTRHIYRIQDCCLPHPVTASAFASRFPLKLILLSTTTLDFGAQYIACTLDPSGFRLLLPGLPAEFSSDLLAKL